MQSLRLYVIFFIYLFLERAREGERDRNISVWFPLTRPAPGIWPAIQARALEWESNQQPFGLQASTQSTEATPARAVCDIFQTINVKNGFGFLWIPEWGVRGSEKEGRKTSVTCMRPQLATVP